MQFSGINWLFFGLVLAGLHVLAWLFAALVRYMARRGIEGQTAWMVVVGVAVTGVAAAPFVGVENALIFAAFFVASGTPMVVEYVSRVESSRQVDRKQAKDDKQEGSGSDEIYSLADQKVGKHR